MYEAAVSDTAVPALLIIYAATRGCARVKPLYPVYVEVSRGVGVYDASASRTAVPDSSLLAACTCCCVLVRIGLFGARV